MSESKTRAERRAQLSPAKRALLDRLASAPERARSPQRDAATEGPLSLGQERLWLLQQLAPSQHAYNVPVAVRARGHLDARALDEALRALATRHEVLRTVVHDVGGTPRQRILPAVSVSLEREHASGASDVERFDDALSRASRSAAVPFELAEKPLWRALLVALGPEDHLLVLTFHHLVFDGWSAGIVIRELQLLYRGLAKGVAPVLPPLPTRFLDFAIRERERAAEPSARRALAAARAELVGAEASSGLLGDRLRPAVQSTRGARHAFSLDEETTRAVDALARSEDATPFMVLLAAFAATVRRHGGHEDLSVGTPIAGRTTPEVEALVGFFVSTIVVRLDLSGELDFRTLVRRVRERCLATYAHAEVPFASLVESLAPRRDRSHNPLFSLMFALQNAELPPLALPGLSLERVEIDPGTAMFDLFFSLRRQGDRYEGLAEHSTDVFDTATIARFCERFALSLRSATHEPTRAIATLPWLSDAEQARALTAGLGPRGPVATRTLHALFDEAAARHPARIAVRSSSGEVRYDELAEASRRLARTLIDDGIGPGALVGVFADRGVALVTALLAVLRTGAAYVPLDPAYPAARLAFMLEDTAASLVLTTQALRDRLPTGVAGGPRVRVVDAEAGERHAALPEVASGELAYVIYTSGSTGQPKGVRITHRAVVGFLEGFQELVPLGPDDVVLGSTTLSFDPSVVEVFQTLAHGATLLVPGSDELADPTRFARAVESGGVTVVQATPSRYRVLLATGWSGRAGLRILCGGEVMSRDLGHALLERGDAVFNIYGPTETTVWSAGHRVTRGTGLVPIGRPIRNASYFVLDARGALCPIGVPGELHIAGSGMADGFLGRPELTRERFVPNTVMPEAGATLYRTGDLVRMREDLELEYLGRIDDQIKVRGFRIEPAEIEAAITRHPGIREAAVTAWSVAAGDTRLVAHVAPERRAVTSETDPAARVAKEKLAQWRCVWTDTYARTDRAKLDPLFDVRGWNSSYTGQPIPDAEMREWVDGTVSRLSALGARRVLEIGCGTGLLLHRLAPTCERYVGTDFSPDVLERVRAALAPTEAHVTLLARGADDFSELEAGSFDLVVLNSVVQYFPDVDYLVRVLAGALRVLREGGTLFVGDVRNRDLLAALRVGVELHGAPSSASLSAIADRVHRALSREPELALSPAFFESFARHPAALDRVGDVRLEVRRGRADNELTRFRYDALLEVRTRGAARVVEHAPAPLERDWSALESLGALARIITASDGPLRVRGIPDARLGDTVRATARLAYADRDESVADLRRHLEAEREHAAHPEDLHALAAQLGVPIRIAPPGADGRLCLDVRARPTRATGASVDDDALRALATDPLRALFSFHTLPSLRRHLRELLPEHMVPSSYVVLDALPRTPSGKIDRRALPAPDDARPDLEAEYVAPRTPTEELLCELFAQALVVDRVGVHDGFFDLGGASMSSVQVAVAARAAGLPLAPDLLFQFPTVAELAAILEQTRSGEVAAP